MAGFDRGPKQGNGGIGQAVKDQFTTNLFSAAPAGKYVTGARIKLKINDDLVYFADRIAWRMETETVEIRELDSMAPYEIAPVTVGCSGMIGGLRIPNQSPASLMYQANVMSHLFQQYFTLEVRDVSSDALLLYVGKAMISSREESVTAEQLMGSSFSWRAVSWKDEMEPMLPDSISEMDKMADAALTKSPQGGLIGAVTSVTNTFKAPLNAAKKLFGF